MGPQERRLPAEGPQWLRFTHLGSPNTGSGAYRHARTPPTEHRTVRNRTEHAFIFYCRNGLRVHMRHIQLYLAFAFERRAQAPSS